MRFSVASLLPLSFALLSACASQPEVSADTAESFLKDFKTDAALAQSKEQAERISALERDLSEMRETLDETKAELIRVRDGQSAVNDAVLESFKSLQKQDRGEK